MKPTKDEVLEAIGKAVASDGHTTRRYDPILVTIAFDLAKEYLSPPPPKPECDVPGCAYAQTSRAAKCGRNTGRFHTCPCACHELDHSKHPKLQGDWPQSGFSERGEEQWHTHRGGVYQIHLVPGSINIRKWAGVGYRADMKTIETNQESVERAKVRVGRLIEMHK